IDLDSTFVGAQNNGRYPAAEAPPMGIDGLATTKYLNFGHAGSGFIVTPATSFPVDGFQITTANDAPGRDPSMWSLYGFNGALTTTNSGPSPAINQTGLAEAWTLISSGSVALPGDPTIGSDQRGVVGPMVPVNSTTAYQHYKFIVDAIKRPSDNIMQFADIQFFADETVPTSGFLLPLDPIIAVDGVPVPAGWKACGTPNTDCSSSPGGELPPLAIDQVFNPGPPISTTKYLNFGEEKSGIIITNSEGPVDVNFMRLRTANDAMARDPASYQLFGTNDPITSEPNSNSNGTETWTLIAESSEANPLVLPTDRHTWGDFIAVNSPTAYSSYRLIFPTVRDAAGANSMQIADVQFYTAIPEPATASLLAIVGLAMAAATRRRS
ncbi:MAG TPA: PEP-CTERM sorting domain-containing protein, partial [Lacipirellulaceae bacterium]